MKATEETKVCIKCGKEKPVTKFGKFASADKKKPGEFLRRNVCNRCDYLLEDEQLQAIRREETMNKKCYSIYQMCGFGCDEESSNEPDGTTAYLRLMQKLNDGGVNLEEE